MGTLYLQIDERIEMQFRAMALKKFKNAKGMYSLAAEEAIIDWIRKQRRVNR